MPVAFLERVLDLSQFVQGKVRLGCSFNSQDESMLRLRDSAARLTDGLKTCPRICLSRDSGSNTHAYQSTWFGRNSKILIVGRHVLCIWWILVLRECGGTHW